MRNTLVWAVIAGTTLLSGCSDSSSEPAGPSALDDSATAAPELPPRAASPEAAAPSHDAGLTVTDVRIAHRPNVDRVVYELGGTGAPGWRVHYTDRAVQDGSGRPVDVSGQAILEVQILGSAYPWDSASTPYRGPDPATDPSAPGIAGVYHTQAYEGTTQSFIGVDADRPPFSVEASDNPTRLVVDIATN